MADNDNGGGGGFFAGLLLGGALGAALALLYAPQRGEETQDLLRQKTHEYSDLAKAKIPGVHRGGQGQGRRSVRQGRRPDRRGHGQGREHFADTAKAKASDISDQAGHLADSGQIAR